MENSCYNVLGNHLVLYVGVILSSFLRPHPSHPLCPHLSLIMSTKIKIPKKIKTLRKRGGRQPRTEFAEDVLPHRRLTAVDIMESHMFDEDYSTVDDDLSDFGQDTLPQDTQPKYYDSDSDSEMLRHFVGHQKTGGGVFADYDNDSDFLSDFFSDIGSVEDQEYYSDCDEYYTNRRRRRQHPKQQQQPTHVHSEACYNVVLACGHQGCRNASQNASYLNELRVGKLRIGMCLT
jgi:hypothetical protein